MKIGRTRGLTSLVIGILCMFPHLAFGAELDGTKLSLWWGIPFAATLLSIAIVPAAAPKIWHQHYGKILLFWAICFLVPFILAFGPEIALKSVVHAVVGEYIPFILLLLALFVVAGGIYIHTSIRATPLINVGFLAFGSLIASVMGTTGASMLLIRPLLRANEHRKRRSHIVIFFIFLVSNIGGALTPLGDPPLFLGFLKGVSFFWTAEHLWIQMLFLIVILLTMFYALDCLRLKQETKHGLLQDVGRNQVFNNGFAISGQINFIFLLAIVGLVLISGCWHSEVVFDVYGTPVGLPGLVRDVGLVAITILSVRVTSKKVRRANMFTWSPIVEVAKLFAGIFVTIIPVVVILHAGLDGGFAPVVSLVTDSQGDPIPMMYFWATGGLSSFLDNGPTYLVFFNIAHGDAQVLMTEMSKVLMGISAGAVFMGATTYIGNAPNLMVKEIASENGVRMPSFFGYMAWSFGILIPLYAIVTLIWYT